jgi:4-hydroxyproline epimerase
VKTIRVIDSHTEGEPTRVVVEGGPELEGSTMPEKLEQFRRHHDDFRSAVVCEPRGSDVLVGALLCAPTRPEISAGILFFNNVGCLGMCGHGTIGVAATLAHLGRIQPGEHRFETPVGDVRVVLHPDGAVSVGNVVAYRHLKGVQLETPDFGTVRGDVAYGGNWFFLVEGGPVPVDTEHLEQLTRFATAIRKALPLAGITGADGAEIDHVEIFGPPSRPDADSKNFVLCPGLAYDRSPCGTGLSAKIACLAADGKLAAGTPWRQESVIGSLFEGSYEAAEGGVHPTVTGRAYINADSRLLLDPADPFCHGIRP